MTKLHYLHSVSLEFKKKKSFKVSIEVIWCFSESNRKFMYRGFPKKEIQPNSRKERHPKTQSKNRNSKSVKSSCLPDKALWTGQKGWHSLNITESSYPPPRKHLHKLQQQQAGPCLGHWTALLGLGMSFKLAELWHWVNKCHCMFDHWSVGEF